MLTHNGICLASPDTHWRPSTKTRCVVSSGAGMTPSNRQCHGAKILRGRMGQSCARAVLDTDRPYLGDLASRPLLLTLIATTECSGGHLPEDRADLYEQTVLLLLGRWQKARDVIGPEWRASPARERHCRSVGGWRRPHPRCTATPGLRDPRPARQRPRPGRRASRYLEVGVTGRFRVISGHGEARRLFEVPKGPRRPAGRSGRVRRCVHRSCIGPFRSILPPVR